jgi:hypothetical protein
MANDHRVSRELGRPCRFHRNCRLEHRLTNSRLIRSPVLSCWGRIRDATMVSPSEGNEVRRDGRQGVGVPHSSTEAGERPSGPRGAKGAPRCGRGVGTTPRTSSLTSVCLRNAPLVCGTAIPQCDEPDASSTGTSGSVGGLGGRPPRSTRLLRTIFRGHSAFDKPRSGYSGESPAPRS